MADQRYPVRRSRGLLAPAVGALALIAALVAVIAFRVQVWHFARRAGHVIRVWFTEWIPDHPRQTGAIIGFAIVAFVINWLAHVRGRLRAWLFAVIVEIGLWLLFWYGLGIPSLNELLGLQIAKLDTSAVVVSGAVVIGITGALFWFLEAREEWRQYRRQHHVDED